MTVYLGIDPGVNGGLAWLGLGQFPVLQAMPPTERDLLDSLREQPVSYAVLEALHARPTSWGSKDDGTFRSSILKSTVTLMGNYHGLRMALTACSIPFESIQPKAWQKVYGIQEKDSKKRKKALKQKAQDLFPGIKITDKTADALLLAELARRFGERR